MTNQTARKAPVKLTKGYIDRLPPVPKEAFIWCVEPKGFGCRVTPSGKVSFVVQGRIVGGAAAARITIGPYGVFTCEQARDVAREHLRSMRMGIDPRDVKRQDDAMAISLRAVADAYFARPGMLKDATRAQMDWHIEQVFEKWKDRPIVSITPAECRKRYEEMATKGLRGKKAAPVNGALAMTTLRTLINFARTEYRKLDGTPIIADNPVSILKKDMKPRPPRTRHIDRRLIGEFWNWLNTARNAPGNNADMRAGLDLVLFLALTGCRRNEGAMLTWDRVNIDDTDPSNCWFHLSDPKNKNPVWLPLSSQAVVMLKGRKRVPGNPHVFPSRSAAGRIMDTRAPLERFAKTIGMERLSAHDLRRTFVTLGVKACRLDIAKLELLTNHVPQGVTARHYLETSDLKDYWTEVQAIADYIEGEAQVAAAKASGANVVSLPQRA